MVRRRETSRVVLALSGQEARGAAFLGPLEGSASKRRVCWTFGLDDCRYVCEGYQVHAPIFDITKRI